MPRGDGYRQPVYVKNKRKRTAWSVIGHIVLAAALLLAAAFLIVFAADSVRITDGAMSPALSIGDTVAVSRISYLLLRPKRGDVVCFDISGTEQEEDGTYIRRVIALPGETVQIMDGEVYVNGYPLSDEYNDGEISYSGMAASPLTLEDDEYFVMADSRSNNFDSRDQSLGPVSGSMITGKVWLRLLPLREFGLVR